MAKPPVHRMRKTDLIWMNNNLCKKHSMSYLAHYDCFLREQPEAPWQEVVGFLDIETTALNASFGYIISYCIKELDGDIVEYCVKPSEIRSKTYDKNLMKHFIKHSKKFDRWVVHWGKDRRHDIPFLRTRALKWELPFPEFQEHFVTDTWDIMKRKFSFYSNRLQTACDFFDIPSKGHRLIPSVWQDAQAGDKDALDFILEHNREDVYSTQEVWKKIHPYMFNTKTSI